jgi:hypothetical protein
VFQIATRSTFCLPGRLEGSDNIRGGICPPFVGLDLTKICVGKPTHLLGFWDSISSHL